MAHDHETLRVAAAEDGPGDLAIITSLRIERTPRHWYITVWNRGGNAGTLCVDAEDGQRVVDRLLPLEQRERAPTMDAPLVLYLNLCDDPDCTESFAAHAAGAREVTWTADTPACAHAVQYVRADPPTLESV